MCPFFAIATRGRNTVGDGLLGMEAVQQSTRQYREIRGISGKEDSRSLLSSESLVQNTGVLVDLKVVHSAGVGRGGLSPTLGGANIAKGRDCVTAEGLHDCKCVREERRGDSGREKIGVKQG